MRTKDNNKKNPLIVDEKDRKNLSYVVDICDFDIENNPNLLIFPQKWILGIDKSNKIFDFDENNGKLTTNNIMGFIGYNETSLTISSRFYPNDNDFFLHYMLCKVLGINVVNLDFPKGENDIHDFLPYLFPSYLQNALSQGLYKQYKRHQYNDANVKGVIDINRHIKINIPFSGKIAYTAREHSYDNPVTQLIRHTIEHLRNRDYWHSILASNAETRANVSQIEYATPTYKKNDLQKIIKANIKRFNHPYFTKYRELHKLCMQILRREKTNFGEKDKIHGLLFDGAWLWEKYIGTILKEIGIEHKTTKDKLFLGDDVGKNQGIIPDFIKPINKKSAEFIGDAKYKHVTTNDNRNDYFQIITYMFRYSCKKGYIIFPYGKDDSEEQNDEILCNYYRNRKIDNENGDSQVIEFGLKIPQNIIDDFPYFKRIMKENEQKMTSKLITT